MNSRPILFQGAMVRALLDGSKTQTRRTAKLTANGHVKEPGGHRRWHPADPVAALACPYGQPGDQLWVRESWSHDAESLEQCRAAYEDAMAGQGYGPYYRATESAPDTLRWIPSIHMPRWASRITLEITNVRLERLRDISETDAIAEGIERHDRGWWKNYTALGNPLAYTHLREAQASYSSLWVSINGPGSWDANPLVWVVEFKVIKS